MNISDAITSIKNATSEAHTFISNDLKDLILGKVNNDELQLGKVINLDRPATTFRWTVFMPEKLLDWGTKNNKNSGTKLGQLPKEYVESCNINLPHFTSVAASDEIVYCQTKYMGVQRPSLGSLSMEFYEDESYRTGSYFNRWNNACFSHRQGTFKPLRAKVGAIKFVAYGIENSNPGFAAIFYTIPTSTLTYNYNGESGRQKHKVDFKILHWEIITYEESQNEKSINDLFSSVGKFI